MFYYFGRKGRLARFYPPPRHPLVIEPFAGSAAYTLHWRPADALLIDKDEATVALWHRLCAMTKAEILAAPGPVVGEKTKDHWHMVAGCVGTGGERRLSKRMVRDFELQRRYAADNVRHAAHYDYAEGTYRNAPDVEACWFIDPPYQHQGSVYTHGNKGIDYADLADWCQTRRGQVIVCEGEGANWLPFRPFMRIVEARVRQYDEVWWTNSEADYGGEQLALL